MTKKKSWVGISPVVQCCFPEQDILPSLLSTGSTQENNVSCNIKHQFKPTSKTVPDQTAGKGAVLSTFKVLYICLLSPGNYLLITRMDKFRSLIRWCHFRNSALIKKS